MNRRGFLKALLAGSAAAVAPARAYSFLTNNPLALDGYEYRLVAYPMIMMRAPGLVNLTTLLKQLYPDDALEPITNADAIIERGGPVAEGLRLARATQGGLLLNG